MRMCMLLCVYTATAAAGARDYATNGSAALARLCRRWRGQLTALCSLSWPRELAMQTQAASNFSVMVGNLLSLRVSCMLGFIVAAGAPLIDEGAEWSLGRCEASNAELFAQLRYDENEEQLHQIAFDDAAKHRMSAPVRADAGIAGRVLCCPRFGVEQGVRADGTKKLRAVDHFSWSHAKGQKKRKRREVKFDSINGHFTADVDLKHDHLDDLLAAMKVQFESTGQVCAQSLVSVLAACVLGRVFRLPAYGKPTLMLHIAACLCANPISGRLGWRTSIVGKRG